jgi:hypothetical protein
MGSQFVDFNADGHLDYITATFDGSPHISFGSKAGFLKPQHILDGSDKRIILSGYWDYEVEDHLDSGRALPKQESLDIRCTSALAFDWDNDGDFDLLLGSYEQGHLYLQLNEGTPQQPKFTGQNIPVKVGGNNFVLGNNLTAFKLADWDGDGILDLVLGSYETTEGKKTGAVYWLKNIGKVGAPEFAEKIAILEPKQFANGEKPLRPEEGLYPEVVDFDGDGDLDLLIGGYSKFSPKQKPLTAAQSRRAQKLKDEIAVIEAEIRKLEEGTQEEMGEELIEQLTLKFQQLYSALWPLQAELDQLISGPQKQSFVWFYERK